MSSLFEWTSGEHTFGEYKFEWLPLHKTPCFGFSGPNACYSSTCDHNPTQNGSKYPKSTKTICNRFPIQKESQIRATSTPFDQNIECDGPELYACETKLSPVFYVQGVPITNIEQPIKKCSNGLNKCSTLPINRKTLHYVDERYQNIDKYDRLVCDQCVREIKGNQPLYQRGSESPLNPESKPFDPSNPFQWRSNEKPSNEKKHPIKTFIGEMTCDCNWNIFKSYHFKLNFDRYKAHNFTFINSYEDFDEQMRIECSFECILCPNRYSTFKELQRHYRNKIEKPYNCTICGAMFKHKYQLWRHRNIHQTLTLLECRGCKKSFRSLLMLKKHCEECRYKFYVLTESDI